MCIVLKNRTVCNGIDQLKIPESFTLNADIISLSARNNFGCMSISNKTECVGDNTKNSLDVPYELSSGVDIIELGAAYTCMSKPGLAQCFGTDHNGVLDLPTQFQGGVEVMASGV